MDELVVPAEPPPVNAMATAPPSSTAAITNRVIQKPVALWRCLGGGGGAVVRARFSGGGAGPRGANGTVPSAAPVSSERGSVASIGTVAGVGAIAAAIAIVVSASLPSCESADAWRSRSRTLAAVCGRSPRRLGQHLHDQVVQSRRNRRVALARRLGLDPHVLVQHRGRHVGDERRLAGQHLVQDAPKRVDVRARVHRLPQRLLGRHVRGGAEHRRGLGERVAVERPRDPEVEHLHRPIRRRS